MKHIIFAALLTLTSFAVNSQENPQDCYCPTCPNHVRKCANTYNNHRREATKHKVERKTSSSKSAKGNSAKAQNE